MSICHLRQMAYISCFRASGMVAPEGLEQVLRGHRLDKLMTYGTRMMSFGRAVPG